MNAIERVKDAMSWFTGRPDHLSTRSVTIGDTRALLALAEAAVAVCQGIDDDTTELYVSPSQLKNLQRALAALTEPTP